MLIHRGSYSFMFDHVFDMKHSFFRICLLIIIAFVSVGGCGGTVIIVSNPAPPLDSDFNGGTVVVVAEGASNVAAITSNGDDVVIVMEDGDGSLLGLVGSATSGTECEVLIFTRGSGEGFFSANGKCRLGDDGSVFKLEQVVYDGSTLDLTAKVKYPASLESGEPDGFPVDLSEDMLGFQEDIVEWLDQ